MKEGRAGEGKARAFLVGLVLLLMGTVSFFYWADKKQVWFCDEIYTYESANGFEQDWPNTCVDQWMTGEDVEAFFAADWDRLSLNDITIRLYNDHVPLYFWLFRMISLFFFQGSGSIWIGLSMNLVFYLIVLGLVYGGFLHLTKNPLLSGAATLLTSIVNRVMIEQATVLRMYMMLLLAELLLLAGGLWILREARGKRMSVGVFAYLWAVSVAGFLTHYDYWIFYAITAALFCLWLLCLAVKGNGKNFWRSWEFRHVAFWVGNFAVALFTTIRLFPYCQWNLNQGKGQMAISSLFDFSGEKLAQIAWGYQRLSASLFGDGVPAALGLAAIFGLIIGGAVLLYRKKETNRLAGMALIVLTAQAYQWAVCFTMPDVWEERYLWGGFTIMALCVTWAAVLLLQELFARGKAERRRGILWRGAVLLLVIGVLAGEIRVIDGGKGVAYLFHPEKDVALLKEYKEIPWIVYGPTVGVYSYYDWLMPEQICFLTENQMPEDAEAFSGMPGDEFVLYIYEDYLPEALEFFGRQLGKELTSQYLTKSTNLSVYLVR